MYNRPSREQHDQFRADWGLSLSKFWNPMMGFDVIAWDARFVPDLPDGTSSKMWVEREKGEESAQLIEDLIAGWVVE